MTTRKLIEVALPLPEINDASAYDKMPGIGPHPKGIHHWWARLPLPVARAVLFASVVDDPSSHPERFPPNPPKRRCTNDGGSSASHRGARRIASHS
ncbi:MAG: hypothetical protein IMHGJWDQ_001472 [Candidatus Fervidibacter sp.]